MEMAGEKTEEALLALQRENAALREENRRLEQEIRIEQRIYLKWKQTAMLFHDALWEALLKYDPEQYGKRGKKD